MTELGQKNENVVALCADLIGSLKFDDFKSPRAFPNRNCKQT
jgi:transketolase C-terminal domain/subunit